MRKLLVVVTAMVLVGGGSCGDKSVGLAGAAPAGE